MIELVQVETKRDSGNCSAGDWAVTWDCDTSSTDITLHLYIWDKIVCKIIL